MPRINFRATTLEAVPRATYELLVDSMEIKKAGPNAKFPSSEYVETWFRIVGGENDGRRIPHNFSLLPQSGFSLVNFLEALGVPHDAIPGQAKGEFEVSFDTSDCIGARALAEVDQETYKTKSGASDIRNVINKFMHT